MRIFVVDDDRDLAESLAEVLELSGHEVEIAFSGEEAVEVFREKDFDVSFMDVVMPGMNGVESFLEIRKIKPDAKVFMLTGYSVAQLLEQAIENGALGVLEKPIGVEELLAKIDGMKEEGMVLVADDDPAFRESLEEVLGQRGYRVCVASTGEEAVEKVMAGGIDLLALDLRLPVLSGLEVYLELKKRGHVVPTVIMSGHLNDEAAAVSTLCDMSITGVLTKPFDPAHLIAAMDRISAAGETTTREAAPEGRAEPAPANGDLGSAPRTAAPSPAPCGPVTARQAPEIAEMPGRPSYGAAPDSRTIGSAVQPPTAVPATPAAAPAAAVAPADPVTPPTINRPFDPS